MDYFIQGFTQNNAFEIHPNDEFAWSFVVCLSDFSIDGHVGCWQFLVIYKSSPCEHSYTGILVFISLGETLRGGSSITEKMPVSPGFDQDSLWPNDISDHSWVSPMAQIWLDMSRKQKTDLALKEFAVQWGQQTCIWGHLNDSVGHLVACLPRRNEWTR